MKYLATIIYGMSYPFRLYGKFYKWTKKGIKESDKWEEVVFYWVVYILSLIGLGVLFAFPFLAIRVVLFLNISVSFTIVAIIIGIAIMNTDLEDLFYQ